MDKQPVCVLLVEDNRGDARLVQRMLQEHAAMIQIAETLADGIDHLSRGKTDIVLLDLSLPDSHGLDTFLTANQHAPDVPFILLTGTNDEDMATQAVRHNAEEYLVKGEFDSKLLWRVVVYAIERKRAKMELLTALDRAKEADLLKSRFLVKMNHDFRTPLNAIIGMSSLLIMTPDMPENKRLRFSSRIKQNGELILSMVDSILDMSKIESGRIDLNQTEFDLPNMFEQLSEEYLLQAESKGLSFRINIQEEIPNTLLGDPLLIERTLNNLVENAIKYTNEGYVHLSVQIEHSDAENCNFRIIVQDSGIGIAKENQERIFQSFYQVSTDTGIGYRGTGLGLAIARELARMMNGDIWVESKQGEGSTFYFTCELKQSKKNI